MRKSEWGQYLLALLAWLAVSALCLWIVVVFRQALLSLMAAFYIGDSMSRAWRARFFDRVYVVVAGLSYLIFIVTIHEYLRFGANKGDLLRRVARVLGFEFLILVPIDLTTLLLHRSLAGRFGFLLLGGEVLGGSALLIYAIRTKRKQRARRRRRS